VWDGRGGDTKFVATGGDSCRMPSDACANFKVARGAEQVIFLSCPRTLFGVGDGDVMLDATSANARDRPFQLRGDDLIGHRA
jgi:hypothetical protein